MKIAKAIIATLLTLGFSVSMMAVEAEKKADKKAEKTVEKKADKKAEKKEEKKAEEHKAK